ncbi:hypothetical protein ERO13_A07G049900v2 [Gossypium hirsutum]|uniref:Uncharacterized protein n=3 Tax=Gossypium TaxID=3633 RepID=A0A5J5V087_GOSBA|nr:hypothetical protein ES319_A07G056700v1 [Gossypium barbadense]KAG4190746.1 hypothetical protein ERO13_A07G049900v2 [Gossypium hirsutum]TYI17942.1 hypothetical protein ES332_A07G058300v1 [Gossypium tomentosum]TYJ25526.1 hypothetical protein E1A91_A07G056900v1 [Gossypium mustelinum]
MLPTMKSQKESHPFLLDSILTEKNSDDTNDSRLGSGKVNERGASVLVQRDRGSQPSSGVCA